MIFVFGRGIGLVSGESVMSLYQCACGETTIVLDTRASNNRLRRRRKCPKGHRLSTLEVPLEARNELVNVLKFAAERSSFVGIDGPEGNLETFIAEQVDHILAGKPLPYPPDRPPPSSDP